MSSHWSLGSRDSILSIASDGSILSIGSAGSVLSVGSAGSADTRVRRILLVVVVPALAAVCVRRLV
jgi:hypothetical protein